VDGVDVSTKHSFTVAGLVIHSRNRNPPITDQVF